MPANRLIHNQKIARMLSNNADDMIRCDEILQHTGLIDSEFEECMKMVQDKLREANTWLMDAQQRLMD